MADNNKNNNMKSNKEKEQANNDSLGNMESEQELPVVNDESVLDVSSQEESNQDECTQTDKEVDSVDMDISDKDIDTVIDNVDNTQNNNGEASLTEDSNDNLEQATPQEEEVDINPSDNETVDSLEVSEAQESEKEDFDQEDSSILEDNAKEQEKSFDTTVDTTPAPVKARSDMGTKFKEFFTKNKLPVIIAAAVLIITLVISVSVAIANRNLVKISSAEDFLEKSVDGKTTYVIKKDIEIDGDLIIPNGMNIDMNKKTLTVLGTLRYSDDAKDKDIFIGNKKGSSILKNGKLVAGLLEIDSPDASLKIYSELVGNIDINVKSLSLENTLTSQDNGKIDIKAKELTIMDTLHVLGENASFSIVSQNAVIDADILAESADVAFFAVVMDINGEITSKTISFNNSGTKDNRVNINNNINGPISFKNSYIKISENSELQALVADEYSNLDIYGKIVSIDGGLQVTFQDNSFADSVSNAIELRVYEFADIRDIINVQDITMYETLSTPYDVTLSQEGPSIMCYVSKVNGADKYILYIDDVEKKESSSNVIDVTQYITQPKTYKIGIKAVSNQNNLLDSTIKTIDYSYNITLNKPNISIDTSDGYKIVFKSVPFATEYKYSINNGEYISHKGTFVADAPITINITDQINKAGEYTIKVIAYGQNEDAFRPSDTAQTSLIKTIKLNPVKKDDKDVEIVRVQDLLTIQWDRVANAQYYSVLVNNSLYLKTKNNHVEWNLGELNDNDKITIITDSYAFYKVSDAVNIIYQYEDLEDITIKADIDNDSIELSWNAVENATSYKVYLNGDLVSETTALSYNIAHTPQSSGKYTVLAIAEYFHSSMSNEITVDKPTLKVPVLSGQVQDNEIELTWSSVANATSYEIYLVGEETDRFIATTATTSMLITLDEGSYYVLAKADGYNSSSSNVIIIEIE